MQRLTITVAILCLILTSCGSEPKLTREEWQEQIVAKDPNTVDAIGKLGHERTKDEIKKEDAKSYRDIEHISLSLIISGIAIVVVGLFITALKKLMPGGGVMIVTGIGGIAMVSALKTFPSWIVLAGIVVVGGVMVALWGFGGYRLILRLKALRETVVSIDKLPSAESVKKELAAQQVGTAGAVSLTPLRSASTEKIIDIIQGKLKGTKNADSQENPLFLLDGFYREYGY